MNVSDLRVRVGRRTMEAVDIATFELVNVEDRPLPAFSAGSHIDVHLRPGVLDAGGTGCQRPVHSLLLTFQFAVTGARPVIARFEYNPNMGTEAVKIPVSPLRSPR